jgi:hypothetical protein
MAGLRDRVLRRLGYVPASDVRELLGRLCRRLGQLDEPMAREFVLDPQPGGIEHKISLMCRRRQAVLAHVAEEELGKLAGEPRAEGQRSFS